MFDLVLRHARVAGAEDRLVDIGIEKGHFRAIQPDLPQGLREEDLGGRLVLPGFVDTHVHLDKSCLPGLCACGAGTLGDAIAAVATAKRAFTAQDVSARATRTLDMAILQGTTRMRTHVEVDPRVGLTSFHALHKLKAEYAWALDLGLCVFPQEGLTNDPGCEDLLRHALTQGADAIGGAPYADTDPEGQLHRIFALARSFDVDIDLHLDFHLDPSRSMIEEVCRLTEAQRWGGRVAIGHVTNLSAMAPEAVDRAARRLGDAGVALTVLPATDLYLGGRDRDRDIPRGVAPAHRLAAAGLCCSLATNNVLNPFTPYGDCSLLRMANLFANVAQIGRPGELEACFAMITTSAAALLNLADYGIAPGLAADLVVLDCASRVEAVSTIAQPLFGLKAGRRSFVRAAPALCRPEAAG